MFFENIVLTLAASAVGYWANTGGKEKFFCEFASNINQKNITVEAANVMLIGRTGAGKSSLINYLLGKHVCETGFGKPVTEDFKKYEYSDERGFKFFIFDSKGLEVEDFFYSKDRIINFAKEKCNSDDLSKWLHTIFYCINIKRNRLEDDEINFIKSLSNGISQSIHIIITHCNNPNDSVAKELKKRIESEIGNKIKVLFVNSVEEKVRAGSMLQFGRDVVISNIFKTLWHDIAKKVSAQYAPIYCEGLKFIVELSRKKFLNLLDEYSTIEIIKKFATDDLNDVEKKVDEILEDIEKSYVRCQKDLYEKHLAIAVNFLNKYYKSVNETNENILSIENFRYLELDEIGDVDAFIDKTKLGELEKEFENIDEDSVLEMLGGLAKAAYYALRIKNLIEEIINKACDEAKKCIPNETKMQQDIEEILLSPLENR